MKSLVRLAVLSSTLLASGLAQDLSSQRPMGSATVSEATSVRPPIPSSSEFMIPGPQRSFLRMAGISQKISPQEVLPLLSRNVFMEGYEGASRITEFLVLLRRYVVQARELSELAANNGMVIRVSTCSDASTLLRILGYRIEPGCGQPDTKLVTDDPERAFLAIDSGFPLPELEQTLQGGIPFEYAYSSSPVPVLFAESDWTMASKQSHKESSRDFLDTILHDSNMARLYWALSRMDPETSHSLQRTIGIARLAPYAAVLDFYGREIYIRDGQVRVPGGEQSAEAWKDLVGASPTSPGGFVPRLLAKDKGWLAAYFDVLSRANGRARDYLTEPKRLRLFYSALRSFENSSRATEGSYRPAPHMLLFATRLQLDDSGQPLIPGGLDVWKEVLAHSENSYGVRKWSKQTRRLTHSDDLLETIFAISRVPTDNSPLQIYLGLSEIDSRRPADRRLRAETVRVMAQNWEDFSDQYRTFSEFPELDDDSIAYFLQTARSLNDTPLAFRGNACGIFEASVGIWQILARQGQISRSHLNDSWKRVIGPFAGIRSAAQLYDAGHNSLDEIFRFTTGKPRGSQDDIIELLAGPSQATPEGQEMHREIANRIRSVLDDQRLVSLDTITAVGDGLAEKARGKRPQDYAVLLAAQTREFEMPRPIFTSSERSEWAAGVYNNHHTDVEMRTDLPRLLKSPSVSRAQIDEGRGQLASFLRDTLVGLNYGYYEPPGAQALHNNPLFVRSHDFAGESLGGFKTFWQAPILLGQGSPAGGGAHFVGSLANLPYALADLEQDFLAPDNVQALIWNEVGSGLLASAVLPRWWDVSPLELHAVALYQRAGEELLLQSQQDEELRSKILIILSDRILPKDMSTIEAALHSGQAAQIIPWMMPADTFYLAAEFLRRYGERTVTGAKSLEELRDLNRQHAEEVSWQRLSHDFGSPHPVMAENYGLELLNVPPMPPFAGSANRFLGESWDSPNLYWARLVDEKGYSPVMMNRVVPELTRLMIEKIFATDLEDWSALLRAMHEAGAEFQQGKLTFPQQRISSVQK